MCFGDFEDFGYGVLFIFFFHDRVNDSPRALQAFPFAAAAKTTWGVGDARRLLCFET